MAGLGLPFLMTSCLLTAVFTANVDVSRTKVFGPALASRFPLPVRYFFIQVVDDEGNNVTSSVGDKAFTIYVNPKNGRGRVWKEVLDRKDGSYLARFRLYNTYDNLLIEVKYDGKHVANSPYIINDVIYHEECHCPQPSLEVACKDANCSANYKQINSDLARFPVIDLVKLRREAVERFGQRHALCQYVIKDNKLYRATYGEHVGFAMFMDSFLLSMMRKVNLPDAEFFVNLGDWPLESRQENPIPIMSWCGSKDTADIVMPTYDISSSTLEALGRVSLDMMSVQGNAAPLWKDKVEKAFFRGRDSRQERLDLAIMGRKHSDLFDVGLTNYFFFKHDEEKYGPKEKHVSFFDFFKYKYQINIDGTVAAYRFPYLLAGGSLVLKQDSQYYEHFYSEIRPWVHYVPFKQDLSDLQDRIEWAKSHDEEAHQIAMNGQKYARTHLMPENLYCYMIRLIELYASRQKGSPYVDPKMKLVEPEESHAAPDCHCHNKDKATMEHNEL